jgi:hypothetical protein
MMQYPIARLAATLASFVVAATAPAQSHRLWIQQFGTSEEDSIAALAPDGELGVFVAGNTGGSLGGPLVGYRDAFLARYDPAGDRVWILQFGTTWFDAATALATDDAGGVFVAGTTDGDLGGDNAGKDDAFLARVNGAGDPLWLVQFGTKEDDQAAAVAPDGAGGAFVAGSTGGDLGGPISGVYDAFLARYDGAGNQVWIVQFGSSENDFAGALAPDGDGGVFLTGATNGELGGSDPNYFVALIGRFNADGDALWLTQVGHSLVGGAALSPDGSGGAYLTGFDDRFHYDSDVTLARIDGDGELSWFTAYGTKSNDEGHSLAPDAAGGVFIAGHSTGSLAAVNAGEEDIFVAAHDDEGNRTWITQFGTSAADVASSIAPDGGGGVFVAGSTRGDLAAPNAGQRDAFLARYSAACYGDCDADGSLDLFDFLCFANNYNADIPYADCDHTGDFDLFDFLCFVNAFNEGC